jgi:hypothetical protein
VHVLLILGQQQVLKVPAAAALPLLEVAEVGPVTKAANVEDHH